MSADPTTGQLAVLSTLNFPSGDPAAVLAEVAAAVPRLAPCTTEGTYCLVDGAWSHVHTGGAPQHDIDRQITASEGNGAVAIPGAGWGWAFPLCHLGAVEGCLVVSARAKPSGGHLELLSVLANQAGAALASVALHRRDEQSTEQLAKAHSELAGAQRWMRTRTRVHEAIQAALLGGDGEQAIIDALHELTALPTLLEDRFGNLRCWSGPGPPEPYPNQEPQRRERQLVVLAARDGPVRFKDRVAALVAPRGEQLSVLSLIDPRGAATEEDIFALQFACTLLGYELFHQHNLVEREISVRRELVDELLAGTDDDGAYARAAAIGHDLHPPHYVMVVHSSASPGSLATGIRRAAAAMELKKLQGRNGKLEVLLLDGRLDADAFHSTLSELMGPHTCVIGVGSRCRKPSELPKSFADARRMLNLRLHSGQPVGASAYEDLGFYRLIDAAHAAGAVDDFIREWLGVLLDYDSAKNSDLVRTLSEHLETVGNNDDSATVLHIHRSTLRYRLARITELTGYDLRDPDTRFNLHAATRSWRFLAPERTGDKAQAHIGAM